MNSYSTRLKVFIELCYRDLPFRVAKKSGINLTTLKKWLDGSDIKLSSIEKLSKTGLNISWLVSGMGTMFAHNEVGDNLKNSKEVENAVIDYFKTTFKSQKMEIELNEIKKKMEERTSKKEKVEEFLTNVKGWYHKVNKISNYTLTNYFLFTLRNRLQSRSDQKLLSTEDISIDIFHDNDIPLIYSIILSFALEYLGSDLYKIFGEFLPDLIIDLFLGEQKSERN